MAHFTGDLRFASRLLLALLICAAIVLAGCGTYAGRLVRLRQIDVEDYRSLPSRAIAAAAHPSPLPVEIDRAWVARVPFDAAGRRIDSEAALDVFLSTHGTTAFLILHDGELVDERYYQGHHRDSLFKSFSISKSILSALVGIAATDGVLRMDDPVGEHLDLAHNPALAAITLEQLADNVSGLRYRRGNAPWKDQPRMYYTTDVRGFVARSKVITTPGTRFEAEELSPLLLGHALERALQRNDRAMTLSRYAETRLWQPMGAEYGALWNLDRADDGLEKTESGFVARAIDFARFGLLYLNDGKVGGRTIVAREWVRDTTTPPSATAPNRFDDGFHRRLWWGRAARDGERPDFYANGHFGQRIYVSPSNQLVLVRLGNASANVNWTVVLGRIAEHWSPKGAAAEPAAPH